MTRIDFYILEATAQQSRLQFAVKLTEKLYRDGYHVHLHTDDPATLSALDDSFWSSRDISFVPHEIADRPLPHCPVTLGRGAFEGTEPVLINLGSSVPDFFSQMERVAEIIDKQSADVAQGRERYRHYRDRGYPLQSHSIK